MTKPLHLPPCFFIFIALLLISCGGITRQAPEIRTYTLDPVRGNDPMLTIFIPEELVVGPFTSSPAYSDTGFLLRRDGSRVEKDYYNRFLVPPARLIQEETAAWLKGGGLFADARTGSRADAERHFITGHLQRLEGDFSDRTPEAVMIVQFTITPRAGHGTERFFKTYAQRIPLESSSAMALSQGWNDALALILKEFESDALTYIQSSGSG